MVFPPMMGAIVVRLHVLFPTSHLLVHC
jgi:hypothetical protein